MFDVKPINADGDLDLERIEKSGKVLQFERVIKPKRKTTILRENKNSFFHDIRKSDDSQITMKSREIPERNQPTMIYQFGETFRSDSVPVVRVATPIVKMKKTPLATSVRQKNIIRVQNDKYKILFPKDISWDDSNTEIVIKNPIQSIAHKEVSPTMAEVKYVPDDVVTFESDYFTPKENFLPVASVFKDDPRLYSELDNVQNVDVAFGQKHEVDNELSQRNFFEETTEYKKHDGFSLKDVFAISNYRQFAFSFSGIAVSIFLIIFSVGFFNKGMGIKDSVLGTGKSAYANLALAQADIVGKNFEKSKFEFNTAYDKFGEISTDIDSLGKVLVTSSKFIPYLSKLSSGYHISQSGKDIAQIGVLAGDIMQMADGIKNPLEQNDKSVSFLKIFQDTDNNLKEILVLVDDLQDNLNQVNISDIPAEQQAQFVELKGKLPDIHQFISSFLDNSKIFTDVLGGNGPRKYLFLFQNNQEMRATGGFIGTYGLMDISNGNIRKFFIDGIFNPDGQLREKVVPPTPIQKISAAWSLHDSNWFPDFPKSAEKAGWFFEKTGGPTVDGVITMTPNVMQRLLAVTGPIEMPEYGVTVDKDNFIEKIQYEVEVDYDKELNQPKQILADLAPKILDKIFTTKNFADMAQTMGILVQSLNEKQILLYSKNYEIEKMLSQAGWSGEVLSTQKDYLSVINTNINGYKTDGVVDEKIAHQAEIQADGSIIDTVTVTRHHNGGNLDKEWWNKVNADYMRIYVPKGSTLISAEGQTREFNSPPLNYNVLGFKRDAQVQTEEDSMTIDEESGTRIYEDSDKTVFANWVYVSPQETATVTYKYLLPFKIFSNEIGEQASSYSLLAQKQSGSVGSEFVSTVIYPSNYQTIWNYPEDAIRAGNSIKKETDLITDKFIGMAFTKD